jgi:predicted TIM-barrel fold metal-dependent hydrolase
MFGAAGATEDAHYQPVPRPLCEIEGVARANGCGHLVLVQPSVYGTDNSLLLAALRAAAGRHRGVVVLAGGESDAVLDDMHAAGVRGVRFNLVSPVGSAWEDAAEQLKALGPRLRERRWHVQWYVAPEDLPEVASWQAAVRVPFVLDHLAGLGATPPAEAGWQALEALAGAGCWIKLSGWYRLGVAVPYGEMHPVIRRVAALFGERMVWGSDWPHTSFPPNEMPVYDSLWQPVVRALGVDVAEGVRRAGARLYQ